MTPIQRGDRVVYTGERSPDFGPEAYRGTVVNTDETSAGCPLGRVLFDDGEEYEIEPGDLAPDGGDD